MAGISWSEFIVFALLVAGMLAAGGFVVRRDDPDKKNDPPA